MQLFKTFPAAFSRLNGPSALSIVSTPAKPLFPMRKHLAGQRDGRVEVRFLNQPFLLPSAPDWRAQDWRPTERQVGTRLWLLNLHYHEFLEALEDDHVRQLMLDWIKHVRPYVAQYWMDVWNSYSLSIRVVVWMQQMAARPNLFSDEELLVVRRSLVEQLDFLVRNLELDIGGNHLIKNIKALLWGASFFEGSEAASWGKLAGQHLSAELQEQIPADGMHYELSPTYHAQVFADLLECFHVLPEGETRPVLGNKLELMAQVVADLTHPDGGHSLFNDGGFSHTYLAVDCLKVYETLFAACPVARNNVEMQQSGYFALRDQDTFFLADCGELAPRYLPAHGHGDALAFEWTVGGQRIFVDAGVFEYNPGEKRAMSRSTSSHNTVTLAGLDQSEFWQAFRVGRRAEIVFREYGAYPRGFRLLGQHNGYCRLPGGPVHQREFEVNPVRVDIQDVIMGGQGQSVEAMLLLHPDCVLTSEEGQIILTNHKVKIKITSSHSASLNPAEWFPDHGVAIATTKIIFTYGQAPCDGWLQFDVLAA